MSTQASDNRKQSDKKPSLKRETPHDLTRAELRLVTGGGFGSSPGRLRVT
jgi:hypothetical protein